MQRYDSFGTVLKLYAVRRMELRRSIEDEMQAHRGTE